MKATTDKEFREQIIKKAMTACRHFNGIQHDNCEAGVKYEPGSAAVAIPCLPFLIGKRTAWECKLFATMTREEAEQEADDFERALKTATVARKAAKDHAKILGLKKGNGGVGSLKCPCCDEGQLRYSVAGINGHMHAKCTTQGCVSWME